MVWLVLLDFSISLSYFYQTPPLPLSIKSKEFCPGELLLLVSGATVKIAKSTAPPEKKQEAVRKSPVYELTPRFSPILGPCGLEIKTNQSKEPSAPMIKLSKASFTIC